MAAELLTDEWLAAVGAALAGLSGAGTGETGAGTGETVGAAGAGRVVVQTVVNGSPAGTVAFCAVIEDGGPVALAPGRHPEPDVVLTWPYPDFAAHWFGELSLEVAYMRGQVKIEGDHALVFDDLRPLRSAARRLPALAALRTRP